jgi:hypothetical protein
MNLKTILNSNHPHTDINQLIDSYYSIENYTFTNENILNDKIIERFNPRSDLQMINILYDDHTGMDDGIGVFDLSMANDDKLYDNLYKLTENYSMIEFNHLADRYIVRFSNKTTDTDTDIDTISKEDLSNRLQSLFGNRLTKLLLKQSILNLPIIISNEQFNSKLKEDLSFMSKDILLSNIDITNYIKNLDLDLKSSNYKVSYVFTNQIDNIDRDQYTTILDKFDRLNKYTDNIYDQMTNTNNIDNQINNLFRIDTLDTLYMKNNMISEIKMNDVMDRQYEISSDKYISINDFYNNIFKFLNELVKRKIIKVIKLYNKKYL